MQAVGELLLSLIVVICFLPTLMPSSWRGQVAYPERLIQVIELILEACGILGTAHAIARLT